MNTILILLICIGFLYFWYNQDMLVICCGLVTVFLSLLYFTDLLVDDRKNIAQTKKPEPVGQYRPYKQEPKSEQDIAFEESMAELVQIREELEKIRCNQIGGNWTSEYLEYIFPANKRGMPVELQLALGKGLDETKYCKMSQPIRQYSKSRSSRSDHEDDDEEEDLNDAMYDEGTGQCDEGTWYEENGYC